MKKNPLFIARLYLPALLFLGPGWPKGALADYAMSAINPNPSHKTQTTSSRSGLASPSGPPGGPAVWVLMFSDEFNETSLDRSKWTTKYTYDSGHGDRSNNDEKEWYVDNAQMVGGGVLTITAKQECLASNRPENYAPYNCAAYPYTSGMIGSQYSYAQKYGYFEMRMKIPSGRGFWPAFWLLPQPNPLPASMPWPDSAIFWPPEIDIMENKGSDPSTIYLTNIYSAFYPIPGDLENGWAFGGYNTSNTNGDLTNYSQGFHTYAIDWEPDHIVWYVDGAERYSTTEHVPPGALSPGKMYVLANLAVGGTFPGNPDVSTVFPNTLQIDYIRVYQKATNLDYKAYVASVTK